MPRVYLTKTVGPKLRAGTIRKLTQHTIRQITQDRGEADWYLQPGVTPGKTLVEVPGPGHRRMAAK